MLASTFWACESMPGKGMLVHPSWHTVVPSVDAITQVILAWEADQLDLPLSSSGIEGCQSLRNLSAIPVELSNT